MACRHSKGDPNCSSSAAYYQRQQSILTPDASKYEIEDVHQVQNHMVLKVRYPNCKACSFEGLKVMVFLHANAAQALKWKKIDPHFRDPKNAVPKNEAPSPDARFPGSQQGWLDGIAWAESKIPRSR